MKKSNILWAAAVLLLAACNQEEPAVTGKQVQMTFTANAPAGAADTRTSLVSGSQVNWEPGDKVGVYSCTAYSYDFIGECSPFTTDLQVSSPTATFSGTAEAGALKYLAVYPQENFKDCMCPDETTVQLSFELPTEQKAVPNGFDNGVAPSLAITDDLSGNLTFRNLGMLVKFRISGDTQGLKSVTLTDTKNINLTGKCTYIMEPDSNGGGTREQFSGEMPYVTLTADSFSNEEDDYYFVIMPAAYIKVMSIFAYALKDGFSLTFTREDGTSFTKTSSGVGKPLVAGTILDLGTIDLTGATWQ